MAERRPTLRIEMLGRFRALVGGDEVPDTAWVRRQPKTLLKLLALAPGHAAHREALMEAVWPDATRDSASNSLNKAIHAVRRALEPELARGEASAYLSTRDRQVRLHADGGVDVDELLVAARAALAGDSVGPLEEALGLYGGELLPEDRYEPWVEPYRAEVEEAHRALVDKLSALYERLGDLEAGARLARELLAVDGYDEAAARRLMLLYARAGHRGRAVETYQELAARLRDDLDAEPEEETTRLFDRIRAGELGPATPEPPPAASAPALPPSNIPRRATRFVGRETERERIAGLLEASRLVTILGPGGIGKTRLAARIGGDLHARYDGRVWMVELASVDAPDLVARAVADLFGVRAASPAEVGRSLASRLAGRPALVILDNCEHLIDSTYDVASELLASAESLRLLATSRERLGVEGETVWRVTPLSVPPAETLVTPASLDDFEATQLFVDRARLRDPAFDPSPRTAAAVGEICRRLDGIPLAIEIAAACTDVLSPEQIVGRLDERLDLPPLVSRGTPERHRSLRALLDWSYELLEAPERALLRRLSVFSGSFSLDAARYVFETAERHVPCADESGPAFLELLARLVDKSLVSSEGDTGLLRFRLLESVHLYAAEKLDASADAVHAKRAFARWCADYAESFLREVSGVNQRVAVEQLNAERDNLRAALRWADGRLGTESELALRLTGALWQWFQRSRLDEGRAWLERAVAAGGGAPLEVRARALHGLGNFKRLQGDLAGAAATLEQSIALLRESNDREALARYLQTLASVVAEAGDYDGGAIIHREASALCREVGEPMGAAKSAFALGVQAVYYGEFEAAGGWFEEALAGFTKVGAEGNAMATLHNLGEVALHLGNFDEADRFVDASIEASRRLGDLIVLPQSLRLRGDIAAARGNRGAALDWYRQAERIHRAQGDRPGMISLLESLARLEVAEGAAVAALKLVGAAAAIRAELDLPLHPYERAAIDRCVADAQTLVGSETAEEAFRVGEATPPLAVLESVLA